MEKLKERITENGIDYILIGDYYIPDLKLPEENRPIGRYGRLHREYLKHTSQNAWTAQSAAPPSAGPPKRPPYKTGPGRFRPGPLCELVYL